MVFPDKKKEEPIRPYQALDWIQDHQSDSFASLPLCEVDLAFLAQASYYEFGKILKPFSPFVLLQPLLSETAIRVISKHNLDPENSIKAIRAFFLSKRYANIKIGYVKEINSADKTTQDGFMVFQNELGQDIFTFRGTNLKIYGWEEDALLCYGSMPGHRLSLEYVEKILPLLNKKDEIIFSGHSKGGNIASFAAIHLPEDMQERISRIYIFDGPGFKKNYLEDERFLRVKSRYRKFVPKDSMIGLMLYGTDVFEVVKAEGHDGLTEHSFFTWDCNDKGFMTAPNGLSHFSLTFQKAFAAWIQGLGPDKLHLSLSACFAVLKDAGIKELTDIQGDAMDKAKEILKAYAASRSPSKRKILSAMAYFGRLFIHYSLSRTSPSPRQAPKGLLLHKRNEDAKGK